MLKVLYFVVLGYRCYWFEVFRCLPDQDSEFFDSSYSSSVSPSFGFSRNLPLSLNEGFSMSFTFDSYILGRIELSLMRPYRQGRSSRIRKRQYCVVLIFLLFSVGDVLMTNYIHGDFLSTVRFVQTLIWLIYGGIFVAVSFSIYLSPVFVVFWYCGPHFDILIVVRLSFLSAVVSFVDPVDIPLSAPSNSERYNGTRPISGGESFHLIWWCLPQIGP